MKIYLVGEINAFAVFYIKGMESTRTNENHLNNILSGEVAKR